MEDLPKKFKRNPVIVLGMHRSGTTLLSLLLQELDVHMGADLCSETLESFSFMRMNDKLLKEADANWYKTRAMWNVLKDERKVDLLAADLRNQLGLGLLGEYWEEDKHGNAPKRIWGWKDPRNTVTLPIWRKIFPDAKIIYIVRNGIDVAASLVKRNLQESESQKSTGFKARVLQAVTSRRQENPRYHTEKKSSITMEEAFQLWAEYLRFADFNTGEIPDGKILRLRYEEILIEPISSLHQIGRFIGAKTDEGALSKIASVTKVDRRFAFVSDPKLCKFYRGHRDHLQMVKHGYDQLLEGQANPIVE
ncbi:MAG: sulfotransferase [Pyrinomonadaceae bacterium]|nr:sulfotransferase [Pyrinomonadaceae bacterium]